MKASRFSDAQKAFILKQGSDGMPVADICRKAGISQATNRARLCTVDDFTPEISGKLCHPRHYVLADFFLI